MEQSVACKMNEVGVFLNQKMYDRVRRKHNEWSPCFSNKMTRVGKAVGAAVGGGQPQVGCNPWGSLRGHPRCRVTVTHTVDL